MPNVDSNHDVTIVLKECDLSDMAANDWTYTLDLTDENVRVNVELSDNAQTVLVNKLDLEHLVR